MLNKRPILTGKKDYLIMEKVTLKDSKGNVANVVSYFPKMYADGAAYLIDGILSVE